MNLNDIQAIREGADMIVCGYAFSKMVDSNVRVVQLRAPFHALVLSRDNEVLETTMDDVEIDIVKGYWQKNQQFLEKSYA